MRVRAWIITIATGAGSVAMPVDHSSGGGADMDRGEITQLICDKLKSAREDIQFQWNHFAGTNTRHFFLDDFFPINLAISIYNAFPKDASGFVAKESFREKKKTSAHLSNYPAILSEVTYAFQDAAVLASLSDSLGCSGLEPDPFLYAGGLSMMFRGDFLNPHIDNSHDSQRERYRRLNLLYYLSPDWQLENGGNFELWDEEVKAPKVIVSKFNRLVVMETNRSSWHSVSPVKVDSPRCCLSNYFFSKTSPDDSKYFHVASFTGRPGENLKRTVGILDNSLRNAVSESLGIGRGKNLVNKEAKK